MARYIDADMLKELIDGGYDIDFSETPETKAELLNMIDYQDTADVRENVRGKWMHDKDDVLVSGYCSCCGWTAIIMETDVADMPFCPNCGADMRGDKHETD